MHFHPHPNSGKRPAIGATLVLFAWLAPLQADAPARSTPLPAQQTISADLDGDGTIETLSLNAQREATLEVRHGTKLVWSGIPRAWKPWKMSIADVDGDGTSEIILGIYKGTKYFPRPHNCLFIYDWRKDRTRKKWLGSSLSKPFTDFLLADLDNDQKAELIALETLKDGRRCVVWYSWNGFGWAYNRQRGEWQQARLVSAANQKVVVAADGRIFQFGEKL